jgi:glucose/arabinose dehydrogenase
MRFPEDPMFTRARISIALAPLLTGCLHAQAQIKYTDVYPGTKFERPVYFGPFPGRPKTNVILEQHEGNALIVYQKADGSVAKDTLYHVEVQQANEMGLLGIAFHPDFNANRKYYLSYNPAGGSLYDVVEERIADATGMKDSGTKGRLLFKISDPYENHNGGTIGFGPKDGYLYYGVGDGGSANDPEGNSQNKNAWLGKMHRIDVNSKDSGLEYHIPPDNPFAKGGGRPEVFAYGLRNPWKWTFDALTNDMWAGDVGQDAIEEVDILVKGGNYGWKILEGNRNTGAGTKDSSMIPPLFTYDRDGGYCVTGGVVFRSNPASKYYGSYLVSDYTSSKFWALKLNATGTATATSLGTTPTGFSSFGTDAEGRVYGCGHGNGIIYLLDGPDLAPSAAVKPDAYRVPHGRAFTAHPGGRLDARAFAVAPILEVFGLNGNRLGALRKDDARLPPDMDTGVYLLKPASGQGLPDLLRIK